jgi:lipid-A-disaccharide synthase
VLKIAIIAGEPSGDMLAASLMAELKAQSMVPIEFIGIGGDKMIEAGLKSSYDMSILSIGGYGFDVIRAIPKIYLMYRNITKQIIAFKPDVFIGVDAPGFNLHVEKKLKAHNIKTVHYVSPTIWAWRYERIYEIKKTTDLMLCIFPIEEPMYAKEHIAAKFIGHHLADQIEMDIDTPKYRNELLNILNLTNSSKVNVVNSVSIITVLVGSRSSEIKRLGKIFIDACRILALRIPNAIFLFPFVNLSTKEAFENILNQTSTPQSVIPETNTLQSSNPPSHNHKFNYYTLLNQTSNAIKASDLVLAKSGTVTLEVALCKKPMVISYKVSRFTMWILKDKLKTKYVGQPNIMLNEAVVPEILQEFATPENLANSMLELYNNNGRRQHVISKFYELHKMLRQNASKKAAEAVLELINNSSVIN